ncbi:hypothetical protein [Prevotella melaninogenica]|nr:hypothetical protein [Prevotella melaninogenica]
MYVRKLYQQERYFGSITNRVGKQFFLASVPVFNGFMAKQKKTG